MHWRVPIVVLSALVSASGCASSSSTSTTDPVDRTVFLAEAHAQFENAGFRMTDATLREFLDGTCAVVASGSDADFELYIQGIRAGDPPLAFREIAEPVAKRARTD